jgi:phosphoglycerate kinase
MSKIKSVYETGNIRGKKVLVRVDWNVPVKDNRIIDDYRIRMSIPTIDYLRSAGAEITLITHFGKSDVSEPVYQYARDHGLNLRPNLRDNIGEESNNQTFAKELASGLDLFVNEAFSVSHRNHASIVGIPKFLPSFAGLQFIREVEMLSKTFNPTHPFLLILGGAKFETKLPLVNKFLDIADEIFIGGAMAKPALDMGITRDKKIVLPTGDITAFDADEINLEILSEKIKNSRFIVWNGPLGKYEEGLKWGTQELAKTLASSTAEVIVGGADTLAAISELRLFDKFFFVSTGGGAMLDFLANGTLPGIEAIK